MQVVLTVAGIPVWLGGERGLAKSVLRVAKRSGRSPTVAALRASFGMPPGDDETVWSRIVATWFDEGRPIRPETFDLTPLGRVR